MKTVIRISLLLTLLIAFQAVPAQVQADPGNQYCVTPPFITAGIQPNLLLMIDNSSSMFDLTYVDKGCSSCSPVRKPNYCFDNTYKSQSCSNNASLSCTTANAEAVCGTGNTCNNTYAGYFDTASYYNYDIPNGRFTKISSFPASGDCTYYHANKFCVAVDASTPPKVTKFSANGNYLNWLSASKFDVQKKILTGGKYDGADLVGESRGCVGQGFVKQPLSSNNGNYVEGGTNTPFPISLQIKGASTSFDATAPSNGGQTSVYFYKGSAPLNYEKCNEAINLLETTNSISNAVKTAVADCIGASGTTDLAGKGKQIFQQSLQECWQYNRSTSTPKVMQGNDYLTVKNFCTDVYNLRDPSRVSANPAADIVVGDASLLCSDNYVGACYAGYIASLSTPFPSLLALLTPNAANAGSNGTLQFKSATYTVTENGGTITLLVSRTGGSDQAVSVAFATVDGTAAGGLAGDLTKHYVKSNGTLSWANNNSDDKSIVITLNDNAIVDGSRDFTVELSNPKVVNAATPALLGTTTTTTVTITDNDDASSQGTIKFESAAPSAVNETVGSITLRVLRIDGNNGPVTVHYATSNGTALSGSDYENTFGDLSWDAGNSDVKSIPIPILSDGTAEPNETFTVTLSAVTGATLGTPSVSTVTITETVPAAGTWPSTWTSDACVKSQHEKYCGGMSLPPVTDPTNVVLDQTNSYANLPAVIADVAIAGQLGAPLKLVSGGVEYPAATVKVSSTNPDGTVTVPSGLMQTFASKIRVGVLSFNYNGSKTECAANTSIPCPKICSSSSGANAGNTCTTAVDCCVGGNGCTCDDTTAATNIDGGRLLYPVGKGTCIHDGTTACTTNENCISLLHPTSSCTMTGAGTHSSGLVREIDELKAASWTPFSEAFFSAIGYFAYMSPTTSRTGIRINSADFPGDLNPSQYACQQNYVLLISDGNPTADQESTVMAVSNAYKTSAGLTGGTCPDYKGSSNLPILSWLARNKKISSFTGTPGTSPDAVTMRDKISTYVVFNGQNNTAAGECNSVTMMSNTATKGGGRFYQAENPKQLEDGLRTTFEEIAAKAASGTAASILSNSEGSGANILQAVFYPKKIFDNATEASWVGEMQNLWYFVDPYINNSTIREDTNLDFKLNIRNDYVARFAFDATADKTMVQLLSDDDGNGTGDTLQGGLIDPDNVKSLWRAGKLLWARDLVDNPRKLYTSTNANKASALFKPSLIYFSSATYPGTIGGTAIASNSDTLAPFLDVSTAEAPNLIDWVHGLDSSTYRSRTVQIRNSLGTLVSGTWRLGDIISSTPRIQSTVRLSTYNLSSPGGYSDKSYESYISSKDYKSRGMVYVGGNDGMLHAFKLGLLSVESIGFQKAELTGSNLGNEEWAYIPKNTLPYLKYLADPNYSHIYSIDGRTIIFDASIGYTALTGPCIRSTYELCDKPRQNFSVVDASNFLDPTKNTWRTVVIGGMGVGGASAPAATCAAGANCVATPITDPSDILTNPGLGYSSYFALDVTDPAAPVLLWEYNNPALGYSTTGPAIIRIGDKEKNGKWYAVFGSGPTGPINTSTHQFLARSDQELKFFVVDLQTGYEERVISTGIPMAFAGSMIGASIDVHRSESTAAGNYQDDALYVGYTKADTSVTPNTWTKGGVGRIFTKESTTVSDWVWSKVIDDIGPVTTAISRLVDKRTISRNLWLFFGTGRYFFRDSAELDDNNGIRALYGIKEPCYGVQAGAPGNTVDKNCVAPVSKTLADQTGIPPALTIDPDAGGWKITLEAATASGVTPAQAAERVVTDTVALTNGTVFFTSFKPTMDLCGYGGNSFLWGVSFDTGGTAAASALTGKALIQLSTGEFREVDLSTSFTAMGGRRMATPMTGKPPSDAPPIVSSSQNKPLKKILHIQEH